MKKVILFALLILFGSASFAQLGGFGKTTVSKVIGLPDSLIAIKAQLATKLSSDSTFQLTDVFPTRLEVDSFSTRILADTLGAGNTFISSVNNKLYYKTPNYWYASDISDSIRRQTPLWDNLVHYYKFDGATGTEDSRGSAPLTLFGTPTMNGAGKIGECIQFDGIDDYATIPNTNSFVTGTNFSVSFWLYEDTQPNLSPYIIGQGSTDIGGTNIMSVRLGSALELIFVSGQLTPSNYGFRSMTGLQNVWIHVVVVRNGNEIFIYRNGVANTTYKDITSGTMTDPLTLIYLGKLNSTGTLFTGKIDELGFFNTSLTQAKVNELYNSGTSTTFTP